MNGVLSFAIMAPAALLTHGSSVKQEAWQAYTSIDSRVRFEMPFSPKEQVVKSPDGAKCRIYACVQDDFTFQAVAIDMSEDLQMALKEVVCEDEISTTRQLLGDAIGGFQDATNGKLVSDDYLRFHKFPARASTLIFADREAKAMAVIGTTKAYIFTVTYTKGNEGRAQAKRFFDSVVFKD